MKVQSMPARKPYTKPVLRRLGSLDEVRKSDEDEPLKAAAEMLNRNAGRQARDH
jgi:hypothetical protein